MSLIEFSPREQQVIDLLLQGKSNKQIALELHIASRTVEFHLSNIYTRLGVASRTEAVVKLGYTDLRESTGKPSPGSVRESAVERETDAVDNGSQPISLRRLPMKKLFYILGATIILIAMLAVLIFLTRPDKPATTSQPPTQEEEVSPEPPTLTLEPAITVTKTTVSSLTIPFTTPQLSTSAIAQFMGETYPDWSNIPAGTSFTKTWTFRNAGVTTWTTDYSLLLTSYSYPLGETASIPDTIPVPEIVIPNDTVEIPVTLQAPQATGTYSYHWQMLTDDGHIVSGDGFDIWVTFTVGEVNIRPVTTGTISLELISVDKTSSYTTLHLCAQYPDTQDWNPSGVILSAGSVEASIEGYSLDNAKSPLTGTSSYRCFTLGFAVGTDAYGSQPVSVTISNYRVDAATNLEANCARAKLQLASTYPGLDFTCGPAGFFYSNVVLPPGISSSQADRIIMDALEQVIYGPWTLSE
jgi:DNA-binding CsgD family transcriptional regulator